MQWKETQRGARRASETNEALTYAVCPACGERAKMDPGDARELTCASCHGAFPVDWDHPC